MSLNGTSMAAPMVSGGIAVLLQKNPTLTPNMVKMILMYTAQPLTGYNHLEQGAGQYNLDGAMKLVKEIRQDLPNPTPLGTSWGARTAPGTRRPLPSVRRPGRLGRRHACRTAQRAHDIGSAHRLVPGK